jgi:hypothetical protein
VIVVSGVDWKVTRALARDLREAPENGRFVFGVRGISNLEQLRRFASNGVPCPEFTDDINIAYDWVFDLRTVYGRKAEHTKGKDIVIASHKWTAVPPSVGGHPGSRPMFRIPDTWYERDYWTKLVPNVLEEWRIHVFDGKSIARGLKVNEHGGDLGLIRNRGAGYIMRHAVDPPKGLRTLAKNAVAACGYTYGAVDLLVTAEGSFVLEVNSAPAMDNYTRGKYVAAIRQKFSA